MDKFTPRQIRLLLGFSQTKMGKLLGMSRQKYASKENGGSSWLSTEVEQFIKETGYTYSQIKFH